MKTATLLFVLVMHWGPTSTPLHVYQEADQCKQAMDYAYDNTVRSGGGTWYETFSCVPVQQHDYGWAAKDLQQP
jgi:hypothetical protein